ncbi:hypothetical protein LDENG_00079530, partial [Lucifuga dentata]
EIKTILGYNVPLNISILYFCNFSEEHVQAKDKYLVKILTVACKKAITKKWNKADPPNLDQWLQIVEEIYWMEKLTHIMRLQKTQMEEKWKKWMSYRNKDSDTEI